jgi:PAS domain S-box-containing protein
MIGLAVVVAIAYFLGARLGLALLSELEGVAVFWPASGIAVGILVARGPSARVPVAIGVIAATLAANLLSDRSLWTSIAKSPCNAGEALLTAWLVERWFGRPFELDSLHRTMGFFVAATLGAATAAVGGAIGMRSFHTTAPMLDIWRVWFLSDGLGIVTTAPLLIGLASAAHSLPPRRELIEGAVALAALAVTTSYIFTLPPGSWVTVVPVLLLFPLLLWVAARCRWVFAAAAAFVVTIAHVWATTFGLGYFGDASMPAVGRVHAAQAEIFVTTLCALVLAALFAERRRTEELLREEIAQRKQAESALIASEALLRDGLTAGHVMAFEWDASTGLSQRSDNASQILGLRPKSAAKGVRDDFLAGVHTDDRANLKARIQRVCPENPSYSATFRFARSDGQVVWLEETGKAEFDVAGRLARIKGLTRDITERKRAEEYHKQLIAELDHRVKNVLATVAAVSQRTREESASMDEFLNALDGRIRSMADTHGLLSRGRWQGVSLGRLIRQELAPCAAASNTSVEGPDVVVTADAVQPIAMVLHELVTNAAKYGALSSPNGRVSVRWDQGVHGDPSARLVLDWKETGGPPVHAPISSGYGTSVVKGLIPYELGGTVDLMLAPGGVHCRLEIPCKWINSADRPLN